MQYLPFRFRKKTESISNRITRTGTTSPTARGHKEDTLGLHLRRVNVVKAAEEGNRRRRRRVSIRVGVCQEIEVYRIMEDVSVGLEMY